MEQRRGSILMATMVAPWAAPVLFAATMCVWALIENSAVESPPDTPLVLVPLFFVTILFGLPLSYLSTAALLVPYALWLRRRGRLTAWRICAFAGALGPVAWWAYIGLLNGREWSMPEALDILYGLGSGLAVGVAFARIAAPRGRALAETSDAA